jgi:hypothetical protein
MPNRWAISSGNWSNAAIWSGSIIPTASDDVFANSQSIYIDTDVTVLSLRNSSGTGISASGQFYLNNGVNVNVTSQLVLASNGTSLIFISSSNSASINCPTMSGGNGTFLVMQISSSVNYTGSVQNASTGAGINHGSKGTLNLSGSIITNNANGNTGIAITNGGILNMVGNVTGGTAATQQSIIANSPSCSINITGNVIGGTGNGAIAITLGTNTGNGNNRLTVNGNVIGNGSAGILAAFGFSNIVITGSLIDNGASAYLDTQFGSSNLTVSGSVIGTRAAAATINKTTGGNTVTVIGPVYAGLSSPGISSVATNNFLTGPFYNTNNRNAVYAQNLQLISGSTPTWTFDTETYAEQRTLYTQNYPGNFPAANNVRQGIVFGDTAQFTGTIAIPPTGSVLRGVPVDNVTGSASFDTQSVWGINTNNLTVTGSLGARLKNTATVAVTGDAIASKGNL